LIEIKTSVQDNAHILQTIGNIDKTAFDQWAGEVMQEVYASNLRRINNQGKDIDGVQIGTYSVKPAYYNPSMSPVKFSGQGKIKDREYKVTSGRGLWLKKTPVRKGKHVTRYFPGGYREFKGFIGQQNSFVTTQLTGQLMSSLRIEHTGNEWALGFVGDYGERVRKGLEKKYKKQIWGVTKEDDKMITRITERYLNELYA
jgi:hypothetical protein